MAESLPFASTVQYHIERTHPRREGLIQLPVYGSDGASSKVVRLHAPIEELLITWTAVKEGAPPDVPHPTLLDSNHVFLRGIRSAAVPMPGPSNTGKTWIMKGQYWYATKIPEGLTSNMKTGKYPFTYGEPSANIIESSRFTQELLHDKNELL